MSKKKKKIYIIGIEGAGTSALAVMYKNLGYVVVGSDNGDHFYGDILQKNGIVVFGDYNSKNISDDIDFGVYSTSIKNDNLELKELKKRKIKLLSYPEALAELFNEKVGVAICGTHGKTTTTAILAHTLKYCGKNPSAIVGSKVIDWQGNSLTGAGDYFVLEADEYQNKLRYYNPQFVILTSVDYDHPDFYANFADYKKAFANFVGRIPKSGLLIYYGDSNSVKEVVANVSDGKVSYGFDESNDYYCVKNSRSNKKLGEDFEVFRAGELLGKVKIKTPGEHNILNATAVIAFCHKVGIDMKKIVEALAVFQGTKRRFEYIGNKNGAILIDDYAHHPEEIKITLQTIKEIYSDKDIITIFHPHSFTRTEALLNDFAGSFADTDELIILDIYSSARENFGKVNSQNLVELINKKNADKAQNISTIEKTVKYLKNKIGENDVVISMGAGDVWRVTETLKA